MKPGSQSARALPYAALFGFAVLIGWSLIDLYMKGAFS